MRHLIYFSPISWASFSQRAHMFVKWFHARCGGNVLWVDPYATRLPSASDWRRLRRGVREGIQCTAKQSFPAWLTVIRPYSLLIEPLPGAGVIGGLIWDKVLKHIDGFISEYRDKSVLGVGKPSELALQVLDKYSGTPSIYDAMDDFPAFYKGLSRRSMERREARIAALVSQIWVSSSTLADRLGTYRSKLALVLNACATDELPPVRPTPPISERPVLGYVGTIGHWFDWSWIVALAVQNPAARVRLIGPLYDGPPAGMPENIEILEACDHTTAIKAMQNFSTGLIPFRRIRLTGSVDPIKYYEYRAMGLPVISTRFGQMALRENEPGVFISDGYSGLNKLVGASLSYMAQAGEIQAFRSENSWDRRFDDDSVLP